MTVELAWRRHARNWNDYGNPRGIEYLMKLLVEMYYRKDCPDAIILHRNISVWRDEIEEFRLPQQVLEPKSRMLKVHFLNDSEMEVSLVRFPKRTPPVEVMLDHSSMLIEYFKYTEQEGFKFQPHNWPSCFTKASNVLLEPWKLSSHHLRYIT